MEDDAALFSHLHRCSEEAETKELEELARETVLPEVKSPDEQLLEQLDSECYESARTLAKKIVDCLQQDKHMPTRRKLARILLRRENESPSFALNAQDLIVEEEEWGSTFGPAVPVTYITTPVMGNIVTAPEGSTAELGWSFKLQFCFGRDEPSSLVDYGSMNSLEIFRAAEDLDTRSVSKRLAYSVRLGTESIIPALPGGRRLYDYRVAGSSPLRRIKSVEELSDLKATLDDSKMSL